MNSYASLRSTARRAKLRWLALSARWRRRRLSRLLERVVRHLRDQADLQLDFTDAVVDAVVERRRPRVIEVLARVDPGFGERALTFSQEGEDLILSRMLEGRPPGFFVDVGAHHPYRFSNTFLLYRAGWRGINIDATPGSMRPFREHRREDINLECLVGNPNAERTLTMFNEPALNTVVADVVAGRAVAGSSYRPIGAVKLQPRTLKSILEDHLPGQTPIVFLNIDVEGYELEVLSSNDWSRFRPELILVEQLATDLEACLRHPTTLYLRQVGYRPIAKAYNTAFFSRA